MQVRWIAAIIGAAVVVCVGGGVGIGWSVWGKPLGAVVDRNEQLEWAAEDIEEQLKRNRDALADARAANLRLTERSRELAEIVERSAERQRAVDDALGRAASGLADAGSSAHGITELARRNVTILDELFVALGGGYPGDYGTGAPSRESQPP